MLCTARTICAWTLSLAACAAANANSATPHMPFAFAQNRGQATPEVRYTGTGADFKAWFEDRGVILQQGSATMRTTFVDAGVTGAAKRSVPTIVAEEPLGAQANYLRGNDPRHWRTGVPLYGAIRYKGVWPGIEIRYSAAQGQTGHDRVQAEYFVAPGASPDRIRLRFDGAAQIEADGSLRVHGASGDFTSGDFIEDKPVLYQQIGGERRPVDGAFMQEADGTIGFRVGDWDHAHQLVIDPVFLFSGYFGGSSQDSITAVAIDYNRNIVVAGWTSSTDLPSSAGAQTKVGGGVDAFVASWAYNGQFRYCTYLGGSGDDRAFGLAVGVSGGIFVTGQTSSTNFPLVLPLQKKLSGSRDAFVAKIGASGAILRYSTYLGGTGTDVGNAIAVDSVGDAFVFGDTTSTNLPVTSGAFQTRPGGSQDTFVAKLSPTGNSLGFLTYLGGSANEHAAAVQLDGSGSIFLGGYTFSSNYPAVSAWQAHTGGGQDGFVTKMASGGGSLLFSTYLGGSGGSVGAPEAVNSLAIDLVGNVIVGGTTSSANFPITAQALQTTLAGQNDGFLARFTGAGALLQSTFVGGGLEDSISAIALDYHGDVYATGTTSSQDFPVVRALLSAPLGYIDAFVVKTSPTLSSLVWGTFLGGGGSDAGQAIAVDFYTSVVVAGQTSSPDYPVAGATFASSLPSVVTAFVTKITPSWNMLIARPVAGNLEFDNDIFRNDTPDHTSNFGNSTDIPVVGDWDGTGVRRYGVFRQGTWYLDIANKGVLDSSARVVSFGQAGDIPVVGDWNGTGHLGLGLFRSGTFILDLSGHITGVPTGQSDVLFSFGQAGDIPIVADWNNSGSTKAGIFRNGLWLVDRNGARTYSTATGYSYGQAGDIPLAGDWDGSGVTKLGVFRSGTWILNYAGNNTFTIPYLNDMILVYGAATGSPFIF